MAFLTKMLQAFLVLPALALVYLLFAQTSWGKRLGHLLVAFGAMLLAGGWWIAIVELWPASSRPYIGGSQTNSILELTLGYNGLGRLNGDEAGSVGGGNGWGETGLLRLFGSEIGGQIAWLLPAALLLGAAALWFARRVELRAALVLWLTWLLVTGLTFSFMAGIFHAYYTVALAPGRRRARRHRRLGPVAAPLLLVAAAVLSWRDGADLGARLGPPRPQCRLPALAEVGRPGPRTRLGRGRRCTRPPATPAGPGRCRGRGRRLPGRPGGVRRQHRGHSPHRLDPERRPDRGR